MAKDYGHKDSVDYKRKRELDKYRKKISPTHMYMIGFVILAFALFVYPGPLASTLSSGMGSIKPGCAKCESEIIYCEVDSDCPAMVKEVFYGEPITMSYPVCEADKRCGYNLAVKFTTGAVACNFIDCVPILCQDECDWTGCSGDYRCFDQNGDYCLDKVWSGTCHLPNPKHEGGQGYIKSVKVVEGNVVQAGEAMTVQVEFHADEEGQYMLGGGIVYPEQPLYAVLPGKITRNYCDPENFWYGKEEVHLYPGTYQVNFTVYPKNNELGTFNVEGVWLKDCSTGIVDWTGYEYDKVHQWTPVNVVKDQMYRRTF